MKNTMEESDNVESEKKEDKPTAPVFDELGGKITTTLHISGVG